MFHTQQCDYGMQFTKVPLLRKLLNSFFVFSRKTQYTYALLHYWPACLNQMNKSFLLSFFCKKNSTFSHGKSFASKSIRQLIFLIKFPTKLCGDVFPHVRLNCPFFLVFHTVCVLPGRHRCTV